MKKILIILVWLFSFSVVAEDISDFEIEGMSIGDSLLDYFSEEEIINEIEINRYMYKRLSEEFAEVYMYDGLETYHFLSFFVKPKDKNYIIYAIFGTLPHEKNINSCYKKMNEISKDFSITYKDAKKLTQDYNHRGDPSGKSKVRSVRFLFNSGDSIYVTCTDFEENLRINNNWIDGLDITLTSKEVTDWFN